MVLWRSPSSLRILILALHFLLTNAVWELNKGNFEKFRKTASFPIFFVDSPSCSRCRLLYPFFYAAAQTFKDDREIFFGRVQDKALIREWGIEELPVVLYYEKGETEWERLEGDITVDNIVETISRAIPGYIGDIKLDYVVEVSEANFDEMVITPKQNVLLLNYNNDERHIRKVFQDVATAFRSDEQVIFCALDASKYPQVIKDRFGHQGIPSLFWWNDNEKNKRYLYGAKHHPMTMLLFVNEKTNLWRKMDGRLEDRSGRIQKFDDLYLARLPELRDADVVQLSHIISEIQETELRHNWESDFADFYVEVLERIIERGHITETLAKQRNDLADMLNGNLDLTRKQQDYLSRKINIVEFMLSTLIDYEDNKKRAEELRKKEERDRILKKPVIRKLRKEEL